MPPEKPREARNVNSYFPHTWGECGDRDACRRLRDPRGGAVRPCEIQEGFLEEVMSMMKPDS